LKMRAARTTLILAPALLLGAPGCDAGVRGRTGLEAQLRISGATLVDGTLPSSPDPAVIDGPTVAISQFHGLAFPGASNRALAGSVQPGGSAVAIGLGDDRIYWIVPAATRNRDIGGNSDLQFSATLSFAPAIAAGRHDLVVRALLADGHRGPALVQPVMISDFSDVRGALQVRLAWDTNADLDLHVVAPVAPPDPPDPKVPTRIEVWVNHPSSLPPRPVFDPYTPDDIAAGGLLDLDSNQACLIDGRREENIVWGAAPPSGHYVVRVDAVSLCAEVSAQWQVDVFQNGNPLPVTAAFGEMIDSDTRFSHSAGSGLLAVEFDIP
jgi:hypothetical protein